MPRSCREQITMGTPHSAKALYRHHRQDQTMKEIKTHDSESRGQEEAAVRDK